MSTISAIITNIILIIYTPYFSFDIVDIVVDHCSGVDSNLKCLVSTVTR